MDYSLKKLTLFDLHSIMKIARYRLNRKSGLIYRTLNNSSYLEKIGNTLTGIILHATPITFGEPFPHMPPQEWIGLCFIDFQYNWAYALLNSGKSNALAPFLRYRNSVKNLANVVTKITLSPQRSKNGSLWYSYAFAAQPLSDQRVTEILLNLPALPLIDPEVNLDFPKPSEPILDSLEPDERTKFIIWNETLSTTKRLPSDDTSF